MKTRNKELSTNQKWDNYWDKFGFWFKLYENVELKKSYQEMISKDKKEKVLEIGCGLNPIAPITNNSCFLDMSKSAVKKLKERNANCIIADALMMPFVDSVFDTVMAFEVLEHIKNDNAVLKDINRILKIGGRMIISVPLNPEYWSVWDEICGHVRRYESSELYSKLHGNGFEIKKFAVIPVRAHEIIGERIVGILIKRLPVLFLLIVRVLEKMNSIIDVVKIWRSLIGSKKMFWHKKRFAQKGKDCYQVTILAQKV